MSITKEERLALLCAIDKRVSPALGCLLEVERMRRGLR